VGCSEEIVTFDEKIQNGKVFIDGIEYEITETIIENYEYDVNNNLSLLSYTINENEVTQKFIYDSNLLIREETYINNKLSKYKTYEYHNSKISKEELFIENLVQYQTFSHTNNGLSTKIFDSSNELISTSQEKYDEEGRVIDKYIYIIPTEEQYVIETEYKNDELTYKEAYYNGDLSYKEYIQYNNLGNEIMTYHLEFHERKIKLKVEFHEYEYNENLLPIAKKTSIVESDVDEENVRNYK
jgi:hypothetical protein